MHKAAIFNDTRSVPGKRWHHGCDLVMCELHKGLLAHDIEPVCHHPVGVDWRSERSDISLPPDLSVVIVNGEGSIHHAARRARAVYLAALGPFSRHTLRLPAFLVNATIFDIDERVADSLRDFDAIYVRDSGSQQQLAAFGIASQVVPDLTVGTLLPAGGPRNGICASDSVKQDVTRAITDLCKKNGFVFRPMRGEFARIRWPWQREPDFRDFAQFIASHELVITGRFHTVTMCVATETPFVAIESNTPKISWFVRDVFGDERRVIALDQLNAVRPEDFACWTDREAEAVRDARKAARETAHAMFDTIRDTVEGGARQICPDGSARSRLSGSGADSAVSRQD